MSKKYKGNEWRVDPFYLGDLNESIGPYKRQNRNTNKVSVGRPGRVTQNTAELSDPIAMLCRDMECWGIRKTLYPLHAEFYERYTAKLKSVLAIRTAKEREVIPVSLPEDPLQSILLVLGQEIDLRKAHDDTMSQVQDRLPHGCVGAPYTWDKWSQKLELRSDFRQRVFIPANLDPLVRFYSDVKSVEEYFSDNWNNYQGYKASTFRALVGTMACQNLCVSCRRQAVRWNLSTRHQPHWIKLYCIHCRSTYDIKTPERQATLNKRVESGVYFNTSYYEEYLDLPRPSSQAKQFIVMVSTEELMAVEPVVVWVGEITGIDPQLQKRSFLARNKGDFVCIYSRVAFGVRKKWFDIPTLYTKHVKTIHSQVMGLLDEKFGREEPKNTAESSSPSSEKLCLSEMSDKEQADYRRTLRKQRNRIKQLREQSDSSTWSADDRKFLAQETEILRSLDRVEALLKL